MLKGVCCCHWSVCLERFLLILICMAPVWLVQERLPTYRTIKEWQIQKAWRLSPIVRIPCFIICTKHFICPPDNARNNTSFVLVLSAFPQLWRWSSDHHPRNLWTEGRVRGFRLKMVLLNYFYFILFIWSFPHGSQKRVLDPLGLSYGQLWSTTWVLGVEPGPLGEQPVFFFFNFILLLSHCLTSPQFHQRTLRALFSVFREGHWLRERAQKLWYV